VAVYHPGELAVQRRAGGAVRADRLARGVRAELPAVARDFLAGQRLLVVASTDAAGRVWASALSGPDGFIDTPDDRTLAVAALPGAGDPLTEALAAGVAPVGLLAIDPATRRRIRVNGAAEREPGSLRVHAEQVYSNCPKYIQRREPLGDAPAAARPHVTVRDALSAADRAAIAAADTFFIATAGPDGAADASHRGGSPGFVIVHDERRLSFPDYTGNAMYMTLGNLAVNPRAGLLFIDFQTGDTLQVSGSATVDWSPRRAASMSGAERVIDVTLQRVVHTRAALPLRWILRERSRFNPRAAVA
jgi:predicted pyridoxine 5'-phosphate oxidase superfamily flavin-nucleotide-binding protein